MTTGVARLGSATSVTTAMVALFTLYLHFAAQVPRPDHRRPWDAVGVMADMVGQWPPRILTQIGQVPLPGSQHAPVDRPNPNPCGQRWTTTCRQAKRRPPGAGRPCCWHGEDVLSKPPKCLKVRKLTSKA